MKKILLLLLLYTQTVMAKSDYTSYVQPAVFSLSVVMMHDVVNPPAASRYYAYCMMGAYSILAKSNRSLVPLQAVVKRFSDIEIKEDAAAFDPGLAAVYCILETGRLMLPSGERLAEDEQKLLADVRKKFRLDKNVIAASVNVAGAVARQVVAFSKTDNYMRLSARLRYTPKKGDGFWYPTPPSYMEAVEPNWNTVTPLVLDSAQQCKIAPPIAYSADSSSDFYRQVMEVYHTTSNLSSEQLTIASFWDCNPFVVATSGHMSLGFKKISPGGHWMNIAGIACKAKKLDLANTVSVLAIEAITQMDAFICCWDEKYRSNRIRPETYINKHIDIHWQPVLQTPPFPEYTSGHSVVSAASAEVLSYLLGDSLTYTDDTEIMFEIPERKFASFRQAGSEAAISRLYGGIHFRDSIENGVAQGKAVGVCVIKQLKSAGINRLN